MYLYTSFIYALYFDTPRIIEQQSLSVYRIVGAGCPAAWYLRINPSAIFFREEKLSESVSTDMTTSPLSLPMFVAQLAEPAAFPCSFRTTFLVESILRTEPKVEDYLCH